jgi:archaellum component FlaF (FlaF/FlaG flagellin family)
MTTSPTGYTLTTDTSNIGRFAAENITPFTAALSWFSMPTNSLSFKVTFVKTLEDEGSGTLFAENITGSSSITITSLEASTEYIIRLYNNTASNNAYQYVNYCTLSTLAIVEEFDAYFPYFKNVDLENTYDFSNLSSTEFNQISTLVTKSVEDATTITVKTTYRGTQTDVVSTKFVVVDGTTDNSNPIFLPFTVEGNTVSLSINGETTILTYKSGGVTVGSSDFVYKADELFIVSGKILKLYST